MGIGTRTLNEAASLGAPFDFLVAIRANYSAIVLRTHAPLYDSSTFGSRSVTATSWTLPPVKFVSWHAREENLSEG